MMRSLLIRGGRLIDPAQNLDARADIWIEDGIVNFHGWCTVLRGQRGAGQRGAQRPVEEEVAARLGIPHRKG